MVSSELQNIILQGETSRVQFKQSLDNKDSIAAELIAMDNYKGGIILFGVDDKTGMGNAVVRNNLIVSFSSKLMKYRGLGSGIRRAIKEEPTLQLENDREGEQFVVRLKRKSLIEFMLTKLKNNT